MTSHPSLTKSSKPVIARRFVRKACGSLLAVAALLGLSSGDLMAQGAYYPQANVLGGAPFDPNGVPITSSLELNYINYQLGLLFPTKSLILPPPTGLSSPTPAEYNAAVAAAATVVANGGGPVGVTITSLSGEVAKYRSATFLINDAIGAVANGVIASGGSVLARQAQLEEIGKGVALANPAGLGGVGTSKLILVFQAAANNADFIMGVGGILKSALDNSLEPVPGTPAASALTSANVNGLVADAINKISTGALALGIFSPASGPVIVKDTIAGGALASATVANSVANLDAATLAVMSYNTGGLVTQVEMLDAIEASTIAAADDTKKGAITQGALRFPGIIPANITTALGGTYVADLVGVYTALTPVVNVGGLTTPANAPAAAAAAMVKYGSSNANTTTAIQQVITNMGPPLSAAVRAVLEKAAGANQAKTVLLATSAAGFGGAAESDVAFGTIKGANIADAGAIAKAVVSLAGVVTDPVRSAIGVASIQAAGSAGWQDVSFNVGSGLKTKGLATNTTVMNAMQAAIPLADRYISVISYVAGNAKTTAGLAATAAANTAAGLVAQTAANTLINGIATGSILKNYDLTYTALVGSGAAETTKGLLIAASLANSSDAVGALAAATLVGGGGAVPLDQLTSAAVNANRTKQFSLTLGASVATALNAGGDIQPVVGRFIVDNPNNVVDIATAATVVKAQFSHFVAHAAAFNAPTTVNTAVGTILQHSRITKAGTLASETVVAARDLVYGAGGRPAAVAAIAAGLTTGLRENRQLSAADFKSSLYDTVYAIVNQVYSYGAYAPYQYNDATPGAAVFRQSNGTVGGFTLAKATGVAGAVTGFVAQMVAPGDNTVALLNADLANALRGAFLGSGGASNMLVVGQAAGQAFSWVSGGTLGTSGTIPVQIATAMFGGVPPLTLQNAVNFGFTEAAGGDLVNITPGGAQRPGAGAAGLRDNSQSPLYTPLAPYYNHHSAAGVPVSNIFSL